MAPSALAYRQDYRDEHYLNGYATFNAGKLGVAWDPEATTEKVGPPANPVDGVTTYAGWTMRVATGSDSGMIKRHEFISEPLPRTLYINASRLIELDLYLRVDAACGAAAGGWSLFYNLPIDAELWVGDKLVAGAIDQAGQGTLPISTPVYKKFRLQSEVDRLEAGQSLRLVVMPHDMCAIQFELSGIYRTAIRIPYYSDFEVAFRIDPLTKSAPDEDVESTSAAEPSPAAPAARGGPAALTLAPLGLLALGLGSRSHRGRVLLLAFCIGFAGCLGTSAELGGDDPESSLGPSGTVRVTIDPTPSGAPAGANGTLLGTVSNDQDVPIDNAHVSILGTSRFTETDRLGRFHFGDLAPGTYTLRVERKDYASAEAPVEVRPGATTRAQVQLAPLEAKAVDFRAHFHNYWPGPTKQVALVGNGVVSVGPACFQTGSLVPLFAYGAGGCGDKAYTTGPFVNGVSMFPIRPAFGELVLPGAYSVEAKVTWPPGDGTVERMGVAFGANNEKSSGTSNLTLMYPRRSGQSTFITSNWEMTDVGHQHYSTWQFFLYWPPDSPNSPGTLSTPSFDRPPASFKVELFLHRGLVPLEPPHRDFWGANSTFLSAQDQTCSLGGIGTAINCTFVPRELVPPETKWVELRINNTGSRDENVLEPHYQSNPYHPFKKFTFKAKDGPTFVYTAAIDVGDADSFYQRNSGWKVRIFHNGLNAETGQTHMIVSLISHRDAGP